MAAHFSTQEALQHVLDSSTESEADFTDLEELQSSAGNQFSSESESLQVSTLILLI